MKKFLKTVTAGALAATFAVSLTACGKKDEDENVLNVMLGTSVKSLDAQVATDGESFEVIAGFTDGLMQMDANGATVNALAERLLTGGVQALSGAGPVAAKKVYIPYISARI